MTLRHLQIFVSICEKGSATAAAQALFVTQPAVSLALAELELYYGQKLFDRISKRLHITEAGKAFLEYAKHIVSLFERMETGVRNWDAIGVMRIGASVTIGNCLLPAYISSFRKIQPQMQVRVRIDNTEAVEQFVLKNEIDFGLIEGSIHSEYLLVSPFAEDRLQFICGREHAFAGRNDVSLTELQGANFLLREKGSAVRDLFDKSLHTQGLEISPTWESTSTQAIIRGVAGGIGISALSQLFVQEQLLRQTLATFSVKELDLKRHFSIIYHKNKLLSNGSRTFIQQITQKEDLPHASFIPSN